MGRRLEAAAWDGRDGCADRDPVTGALATLRREWGEVNDGRSGWQAFGRAAGGDGGWTAGSGRGGAGAGSMRVDDIGVGYIGVGNIEEPATEGMMRAAGMIVLLAAMVACSPGDPEPDAGVPEPDTAAAAADSAAMPGGGMGPAADTSLGGVRCRSYPSKVRAARSS